MLPRIEAGETLTAAHAAQLAQPVSAANEMELDRELEQRRAMIGRIEARAEGRDPEARKATTEPPSVADLAAIGIAVTPLPAMPEENTDG